MKPNQKQVIATLVKEGRLARGYTQKELSELTNISVRSIQRIENGEILPRSYTIKTLAATLGFSFENLQETAIKPAIKRSLNRAQKIILSIGSALLLFFLSWAFIAQSSRFPETDFETIIFSAIVTAGLTLLLLWIWKK
jgi:transcriptional regulator with XRE-family HTH domain